MKLLIAIFITIAYSVIIPKNCTTSFDCEKALVCYENSCTYCKIDKQCFDKNYLLECKKKLEGGTCQRKGLYPNIGYSDIILGAMGLFIGGLSSISGIGGSAIFVPLLQVVGGFDITSAISISKSMVLGTSFVTILIVWRKKLPGTNIPLIDFRLLSIFTPMILLGTISGVLIILVTPEILLLVLLMIVLPLSGFRTVMNGIKMYKKENAEIAQTVEVELQKVETEEPERVNNMPIIGNIVLILIVWIGVIFIALLQGGFGNPSIIGVRLCSKEYWVLLSLNFPWILSIVAMASFYYYKREQSIPSDEKQFKFTIKNLILLPILSFFSGLLSTSLGAAMIRNTILMELGTDVSVSSATCKSYKFNYS